MVAKKKRRPRHGRYTRLEVLTARAVKSALWWLKRYTPAAVPTKYAPYHQQLIELPEPGHSRLVCLFRGAAKTTVLRGVVIHSAIHDHVPVQGILLIRATYGDAKADRKALVRWAQMAGHVAAEYGDEHMLVINNTPIWTRTPGSAVRGIQWVNPDTGQVVRPNLAVVDDLETRASARSKTQTDNIQTWLFSDVMQTAGQGDPMRTLLVGTPITPTCLVAQAMRGTAPFDTWDTPLIVPIVDADGNPAWPDNYDAGIRARVPDITWATEYMLDPLPPGTLLFPPSRTVWNSLPASKVHEVVVSIDPAGDGDDATAAVAMCMTPRGLHIVNVLHHTGSSLNAPEEIGRFVRELQEEGWLVIGLTFEGVGGWVHMKREVQKAVAPLRVASDTPTMSKVERAKPLTVWHRAGALSVDARLKGSEWDVEFHSFDVDGLTVTGHDDCTDATAWAAQQRTGNWRANPPQKAA